MKNLKRVATAALFLVMLSACSTMTPSTYAPSADNNVALRKLAGAQVNIVSITETKKFDAGCRMMGPIKASGSRSVAQFVKDSFNDEFKFANVYGPNVALEATLTNVAFSSMSGLTGGWWEFDLTLKNPKTGHTLMAQSRYEFPSGFDAMTACMQTAQALTPGVQLLIKNTVTQPGFALLVGR